MTIRAITPFDRCSLLLFTALTVGAASASWAQNTPTPLDNDPALIAKFAQADTNGDKMLGKEEAKAIPALVERFAQVDANGDGMVSQGEFMASIAPASR